MKLKRLQLDHYPLSHLLREVYKKSLRKRIWQNGHRPLIVLARILTVGLMAMTTLLLSSCSTSTSQSPNPPATFTPTSPSTTFTPTSPPATPTPTSPPATPTPTNITTNPYSPYKGTLVLNDLLKDNSKGYDWNEITQTDYGFCKFIGGAYHAEVSHNSSFFYCATNSLNLINFAYEVQMKILTGDQGGIVFRTDGVHGSLYLFTLGVDGTYSLSVIMNHNFVKRASAGSSSAIKTGYNQSNLIAIVAQGNSFDLYVNQQQIAHVNDNTLGSGQIGVVASETSKPTEVAFSNARVWTL